jgi:outer membrane lipoprotein-sorting protein
MWLAPFLLVMVVNADEGNDAEKAYQEMAVKISKAKAFECTFEVKNEGTRTNMKGTMALVEGNKLRFEMEGENNGRSMTILLVSDGLKTVTVRNKEVTPKAEPPKNLTEGTLAAVSRCGSMLSLFVVMNFIAKDGEKPKTIDVNTFMPISDIKFGKKESLDGKETQIIEYTLSVSEEGNPKKDLMKCKVWIDTKTLLPVKRIQTSESNKDKITITEIYSKVAIDGKIDAKAFELPK